jgi:EAL domain-containing protein (putative c-di-GMP-specific phosphodiesterase class I)
VRLSLVVDGPGLAGIGDQLPFGAVKMSVRPATHEPGDAEALSTIRAAAEIARCLAAPTIATDVDCAECQATARQWDCEFGQGSLYGAPADPGDLLPGLVAGH